MPGKIVLLAEDEVCKQLGHIDHLQVVLIIGGAIKQTVFLEIIRILAKYQLVFCTGYHWYFVQVITIMACQKSPTTTDSNADLNWWLGFNQSILFICLLYVIENNCILAARH